MSKQIGCTLLYRLLLPLSLFGAAVVRYNGFSLVYLLLLLVSPLLAGPSRHSMSGQTGRYLITTCVLSSLMLLAQVVFQGVLLGKATDQQPYGSLFANCSTAERVLRQVGLQRLETGDVANILRIIIPDIGMCIISITVTVICFKAIPQASPPLSGIQEQSSVRKRLRHQTSVIVNVLGQVLTALLLALSGIAYPSVLSAVYFLSFLVIATWWGCYKSLGARFAIVRIVLLVFSALHLVLLYLYQFQFFQEALHPSNFYARLFGLTGIIKTTCDKPWLVSFYSNRWPVYVSPGIILMLYMVLALETQRWLRKNTDADNTSLITTPRRRMRRHRSDASERQVLPTSGEESLVDDSQQHQSYSSIEPTSQSGEVTLRKRSRALSRGTSRQMSYDPTQPRQRSPLSSIFTYIMKQSYAASLIIMMVWSITYHSWLTFVYLLVACIIWMIPAKRKVCLTCSPLIVSYAEGLLLMQYIYGFNLPELPKETASGYSFKEIGLVAYDYPCLPLGVQVFFTFFFWLTLRQHLREVQERAQENSPQGLPLRRVSEVEAGVTNNGSCPPTPTMQEQAAEQDTEPLDDADTRPLSTSKSPTVHHQSEDVVDGYDSETMKSIGRWVWHLLCKYWIIVCAVLFLVMAIQEAVIYRIIYMFLFCYFVITFKLCYWWWRLTINVFWWVTIVYSMLVLCIIYTYQFDKFPEYWQNSTGFTPEILHDIGLEQFDTATLFVKLLTPTSFLVIIILQLHYFQTPFLRISDISRFTFEESRTPLTAPSAVTSSTGAGGGPNPVIAGEPPAGMDTAVVGATDTTDRAPHRRKWRHVAVQKAKGYWNVTANYLEELSVLLWRIAEVHWIKILALTIFLTCLFEVSAINTVFMLFLLVGLPIPQLHFAMTGLCLIWAAIASIAKMMFQLTIIKHGFWYTNCTNISVMLLPFMERKEQQIYYGLPHEEDNKTEVDNYNGTTPYPFNQTIDNAAYFGLRKTDNLGEYLQSYILIITAIAFHGIIWVHQKQHFGTNAPPPVGIIFADIKRPDADRSVLSCLKYFVNYAFFKFGLEICFVMTVITMVIRLDAFSLIYGVALGILLLSSRKVAFVMWPIYIVILVILLFIQYLSCLGVPLGVCWGYPWDTIRVITRNLQIFLYLPNYIYGPDPTKLVADFFQLLFVALQWRVFYIEYKEGTDEYGGGDNKDIIEDVEANRENPVEDFLSCKDSYLDYIKTGIFMYMFWVTLVIVFMAGTTRISLFCMGYLVGVFFFLWFGQEMLIKPLGKLLRLWKLLLMYNYFVIMCKSALQLVGCVYLQDIVGNYCWLVQLLSIVCLRAGHYIQTEVNSGCTLPEDEAGLTWDTICFVFLLIQLRIYKSHYFRHVVTELSIQNKLAARGAELINRNLIERVEEQKAKEAEVLLNIKRKMERIKLRQQKLHSKTTLIDAEDHYAVIRSGDYFMFEGDSDDDMESSVDVLDTMALSKDIMQQSESKVGPLEIINAAMTGGTKKGLQKASQRTVQERLAEGSLPESESTTPTSPQADSPFVTQGKDDPPTPKPSTSSTPDDGDGSKSPAEVVDAEEPPKEDLCTRIVNSLKLAWAVFGSFLDYLIGILEDISHEYRSVAKILDDEKEAEKRRLKEEHRLALPTSTTEQESTEPKTTTDTVAAPPSETAPERPPDDSDGHGKHPGLDLDLTTKILEDKKEVEESKDAEEEFREKTPRIFQLCIALFEALISRSELLCYFAMILNHLVSASLLSISYPISVFIWAMLSVPRPTKTYWVTIITYTEAVVVVKYLFQFGFFPWNENTSVHDADPFWPPRIIGIEKKDVYAAYDLFLLVCLFIHRTVLRRNGLWKDAEDADADLAKAELNHEMSRQASPLPSPGATSPVTETATVSFTDQQSLEQKMDAAKPEKGAENAIFESDSLLEVTGSLENEGEDLHVKSCEDSTEEPTKKKKQKRKRPSPGDSLPDSDSQNWCFVTGCNYTSFIEHLCHVRGIIQRVRDACWQPFRKFYQQMTNPKFNAATDVYALMFLCDFINFFIVVFGYQAFGPSATGTGGTVVTDVLQENKVPGAFLAMLLVQFVMIIIDRALYLRKQVVGKFVYQIILVAFMHIYLFFGLPYLTNRAFTENVPVQLWYFIKCIYFGLSAYQIRSGYPTRILGNFLTKKYNYVNLFLFKGFLAIPFLLELRALMDWMWTDTTLALTSWLEMEDIYANIFQLKCWRRAEEAYPTPRGQLRKLVVKYGMGGLILFLLIFIIWFPLLLFSLADTVLYQVNPPVSCNVEITLSGYQPIFQMSSQQQFIHTFSEADYNQLLAHYSHNPVATAWLSSYKAADVSRISVNGESTAIWGISPPSQQALIKDLNGNDNSINLIFSVSFERSPTNGLSSNEAKAQFITVLDPAIPEMVEIRKSFASMISNSSSGSVNIINMFPRYMQLMAKDTVRNVSSLVTREEGLTNVTFVLKREADLAQWWELTENAYSSLFDGSSEKESWSNLTIVAFSDRVAPAGLSFFTGYGIIGLYVSLVLVIGRFVRIFFSGLSMQIMFQELPYVDKVLKLCLDVYLVREVRELVLEEELFAKLIFLYRSPETMIKWTRQKID